MKCSPKSNCLVMIPATLNTLLYPVILFFSLNLIAFTFIINYEHGSIISVHLLQKPYPHEMLTQQPNTYVSYFDKLFTKSFIQQLINNSCLKWKYNVSNIIFNSFVIVFLVVIAFFIHQICYLEKYIYSG